MQDNRLMTDILPEEDQIKLQDREIGFCVKRSVEFSHNMTEDREKGIGVYIPVLMSEIEMGTAKWEKKVPVDSSCIQNYKDKPKFAPQVETKNYINCPPLRISNIEQAPIKTGEEVYVKFLDNDIKKPRYTVEGTNENKRDKDRYRMFVKDTSTKSDELKQYEMIMDSEAQRIRFTMNNGRGEVSKYQFDIDGCDGYIRMKDDFKNEIMIYTKDKRIVLHNSDDTFVDLWGTRIFMHAATLVEIDTPYTHITGNVQVDQNIHADGTIIDDSGNTDHHCHGCC